MKKFFLILVFFISFSGSSQIEIDSVLTLEEYIGYVKKYHPIIKQARLVTSKGEAKLLKARGAFDPKVEVDYATKEFKNTAYYNKLNATFKIPTWYGIEFKANYENNEGNYLNPELTVPQDGLYSAGVSVSLARGLLTNERMTSLKQAKLYAQISEAKQQLLVNDVLYNAVDTYFLWLRSYQEFKIYDDYIKNAKIRLENVIKSFDAGDKPAIDTLEARINLKNRVLDLEKARIKFVKSSLEIANYLWLEDNIPLELNNGIVPDSKTYLLVDKVLNNSILNLDDEAFIENHPKIRSLNFERKSLVIEKRLKQNNLLPRIDFQYNFLSTDYDNFNSYNTLNYKSGLNISMPLFLRKERGDLKLVKIKLQDIEFDVMATKVILRNKINAIQQQLASYQTQSEVVSSLVDDYRKLVRAEERKFSLGEGSLFLINYREAKLIETELKMAEAYYNLLNTKAKFVQQVVF